MLFSLANLAEAFILSLNSTQTPTPTTHVYARYVETGKALLSDQVLSFQNGHITQLRPAHACNDVISERFDYVLPGCVNAHSHAFQILLRPTTGQPAHFKDWVDRFLYPQVTQLDQQQLYTSARRVFKEMLRAGITTVGEFHYVNNLPDGSSSEQHYAHTLIQAARDVGVRITLIRTLYDQCHKLGQKRFQEPTAQAIDQTRALAQHYAEHPNVSVLPAPHSLHGASQELVMAGAELARELNTPWHMHLSEQPGDAEFALQKYGHRPLACLEHWGILDQNTCIVHGIWFDDEDLERMQQRRCRQVYNPLTNMALGDGMARLPELLNHGVPVALGTDANTDSSLFLEARMAEYLQRSQKLSMGHVTARQLFAMLNQHGAHALGLQTGLLEVGYAADFLALDLQSPSLWPVTAEAEDLEAFGEAMLNQMIFSMVPQEAIQQVYVAGQAQVLH